LCTGALHVAALKHGGTNLSRECTTPASDISATAQRMMQHLGVIIEKRGSLSTWTMQPLYLLSTSKLASGLGLALATEELGACNYFATCLQFHFQRQGTALSFRAFI
jgi:hypothetical protein